jgi:hypothetical protein
LFHSGSVYICNGTIVVENRGELQGKSLIDLLEDVKKPAKIAGF